MINKINIFRRSPILLVFKLIVLELVLAILYGFFGGILSTIGILWLKWLLFGVITVGEMVLVTIMSLRWSGEVFVIGDGEVVHKKGVLNVSEETVSLRNVQAIASQQSFWGRWFNYGSIKFFSPILKQEYWLTDIADVKTIKTLIEIESGMNVRDGAKDMIIPVRGVRSTS